MDLKTTQMLFREWVRNPHAPDILEAIVAAGNKRLNRKERIQIYREDYHFRLVEALGETYENIARLLGPERCDALIARYLQKHPSRTYDLTFLGEDFSAFLREDPVTQEFPFIVDLARAEWLMILSFHAPLLQPIAPSTISEEMAWPDARFTFQPALTLLESPWPLTALLNLKNLADEEVNIDLKDERPKFFLIYQEENGLTPCEEITQKEFEVVRSLQEGKTFGWVCAEVLDEQSAVQFQEWFARWLQRRLIVTIA